MTLRTLGIIVIVAGACGEQPRSPAPPVAVSGSPAAVDSSAVTPPDSLALTTADGATVWFVEGRRAADSAGMPCIERTLEIRRDTSRIRVPLFYTRTAPTRLNDSALRGELYRDCRPVGVYRIHLRTGAPTPLLPGGR